MGGGIEVEIIFMVSGTWDKIISASATNIVPDSTIAASTNPSMIIFSIRNDCIDKYLRD